MRTRTASLLPAVTALAMLASTAMAQETDFAGGDLRAPSPRIMNPDRPGYFQIGAGPAFALGLSSDRALYNINAAYNRNLSDRFTAKALVDFNLGSGTDDSRFINLAIGGDYYLNEVRMRYGIPYVTADAGFGFARNDNDQTKDAVAVGLGTGFKFATQSLNFDINLHYTLLTAQLDGTNPSIIGLRAALAF